MVGLQRIDRVRRDYNKWVANQTLEDFALRFTAKSARRFSSVRVGQTALGAVSFLALEAISGTMTLHYGFGNTVGAIAVAAVIIFLTGVPICFYAAEYGVDIDLLTRGAGFGYIGSTITSLIYASFTFILFAIESSIMAIALELCLNIPLWLGYLISALAVIPLVTHGIAGISRFQVWTQPFWIALNILPVVVIAAKSPTAVSAWTSFAGDESRSASFALVPFGAAASIALAFIVQIGEQVDYLRFLPTRAKAPMAWWTALLSSGPGWIVIGVLKLLAGSFLAVYLLRHGTAASDVDPPHMYATAFRSVVDSPVFALTLTCAFVVVCQLKINVTNAYAGSIAWSNFFSRLTHHHPGRVVWLVFNVVLALLVMELGVYRALEQTLAVYSSIAVAWMGAIVADLVVNKPLGLSPPGIEFKRAHLYDINPVGVGAMAIAAVIALTAQSGVFGLMAQALAPFLSLVIAFVSAPAIAWATRGRFYLARQPEFSGVSVPVICCVCENSFEPEDMAHCPAYAGPICSLCCSLDARCQDLCKPNARLRVQAEHAMVRLLPRHKTIVPQVVDFGFVALVSLALTVSVLALVGLTLSADPHISHVTIVSALWKTVLLIMIVAGVVGWLFVLMQTSGRAARSETNSQTRLLMDEIAAHRQTDLELKKAKEAADAANFAKSRYVVGLSHELRTPLNSIMGYAQLLERDESLGPGTRGRVAVMKRSAHHLAGLIDGLLDISKIEAGKLDLSRDEVAMPAFVGQLIDMFSIQAQTKGIRFTTDISKDLPEIAAADEKRLRQVLINLLSNAIKFTKSGAVTLRVSYRNEVARFAIEDTGPGIPASDLERIFMPFERLRASTEPGTGLGLTICRLLAGVMGGEITVTSEIGAGSTFRLRLFLPRVAGTKPIASKRGTVEYAFGKGRTVLVADDDSSHRSMMAEALDPLGFETHFAEDGAEAIAMAAQIVPDLCLLDIEMPQANGWQVAERLRERGHTKKIVMLSASAMEEHRCALAAADHDAFLMKPVDIDLLIETMADLLLSNRGAGKPNGDASKACLALPNPDSEVIEALIQDGEIGYIRGLRDRLTSIEAGDDALRPFAEHMRSFVERMDMPGLIVALERARASAG